MNVGRQHSGSLGSGDCIPRWRVTPWLCRGQRTPSRRTARTAGSPLWPAICISRPAGPARDTGLSAIPAALATPPRGQQRAPAHLVPDREEYENNDHANQRNTHPVTSWRAELLRRGVGSAWGDNRKWSSCPNKASLPRRDFSQCNTSKPVPDRPGSGGGAAPGQPARIGRNTTAVRDIEIFNYRTAVV
jgi:hypothetical protein